MVVAEEQLAVVVVEVHAAALAVAPHLAAGAGVFVRPLAVAVRLEAVLPHLPEVVAVDVALVEIAAYACAARYGAVGEYGGHLYACAAEEVVVAHAPLVVAHKTLAAVVDMHAALAHLLGYALTLNELEHLAKLVVAQLQVGVLGGAPHRENGEDAPVAHPETFEVGLEAVERADVAGVDACYHVPHQLALAGKELYSMFGAGKALVVAAYPVVVGVEAVEAHGDAVHAASHKACQALLVEQVAVGNHAPGVAAAVELQTHLFDIGTQQRLAAGKDDKSLVGVYVRRDAVDNPEEVGGRHVAHSRLLTAVAAAVAAVHVAAQRALPEERPQLVDADAVVAQLAVELKPQPLFERDRHGKV